tara:strand:- start:43 stop:789 length:747 start_codon:yes stop_codon:yes gene_type:complete
LSENQEYYDDLLAKGYTREDALLYTQKYYPEFSIEESSIDTNIDPSVGSLGGQEFNPYAPSPLIEKQEIISQDVKDKFTQGLQLVTDKASMIVKDKRLATGAGIVFFAVLVAAIILLLPTTSGPIEGTWIKADGQEFEFDKNGDLDFDNSFTSTWDYQGSVLTMTSTRLAVDNNNQIYEMEIVQKLNIELIDDDNAMWLSWVSLTVDGQQSSQMSDECFLMMKQSTASTPDEFYTQSLKYEDDRPNWC